MRTRRIVLGLMAMVVAPLLVMSSAWACTGVASLKLGQPSAVPGQVVAAQGAGFSAIRGTPVQVHFNDSTGPLLWTGTPDASGNIAFSFTTPQAQPNNYVIIAMQNDIVTGKPYMGTPARAVLQITAAPQPSGSTQPQPSGSTQPQQSGTAQPQPSGSTQPQQSGTAQPQQSGTAQSAAPVQQSGTAQPQQSGSSQLQRNVSAQPAVSAHQSVSAPVSASAHQAQSPKPAAVPSKAASSLPVFSGAPAHSSNQAAAASPQPGLVSGQRHLAKASSSGSSLGSVLALGLVAGGLLLSLGASAYVVARRRTSPVPGVARVRR